jgi:hypothetical protein
MTFSLNQKIKKKGWNFISLYFYSLFSSILAYRISGAKFTLNSFKSKAFFISSFNQFLSVDIFFNSSIQRIFFSFSNPSTNTGAERIERFLIMYSNICKSLTASCFVHSSFHFFQGSAFVINSFAFCTKRYHSWRYP